MRNFFKKKEDFEDLEKYEEIEDDNEYTKEFNFTDINNKKEEDFENEPRIIESYPTNEENNKEIVNNPVNYQDLNDEIYEDFEIDESESKRQNRDNPKTKKIINICFYAILILCVLFTIDHILVTKYNKGPFLAIKTATYKDGGTKVQYGLGYKVIKYHQIQGRRDTEVGNWSLQYNTNPIDISDVDLAIDLVKNPKETSSRYTKKFIRLSSTVKEVQKDKNLLILEYYDEDSKYTLWIYCTMAEKDSHIDNYEKGDTVNILGTITKFEVKDKTNPNRVYIENTFAEYSNGAEIIEIE